MHNSSLITPVEPMKEKTHRKEEIQLLVAASNLPKALNRSMDFVRDFSNDRAHMQQLMGLRTAILKQDQKNSNPEQVDAQNKQIYQLLELLDVVESTTLN